MRCAGEATSPKGSSTESACQPPPLPPTHGAHGGPRVKMQVIMPYTRESFTEAEQDKFRAAFARQASVGCKCELGKEKVDITGIVETTVTPGTRRRLHTMRIAVDVTMWIPTLESAKLLVESEQLSLEKLNVQFAQEGLQPIAEVSSRPVLTTGEDAAASSPVATIVVVLVTILVLACSAYLLARRRSFKIVDADAGDGGLSGESRAEEGGDPALQQLKRRISSSVARLSAQFSLPQRHQLSPAQWALPAAKQDATSGNQTVTINDADTEAEDLIAQIKSAAQDLGFHVQDGAKDQVKYDAEKLVMGMPPDAGRGIAPFLNYQGGPRALYTQMGRGLDAINEEISKHGSEEEKECRDYILYNEAGKSEKKFQQNWKRDCDPRTGKVLACRQVDVDCEVQDIDDSTPRVREKRGMRFADFVKSDIARFCELEEAEVFALRYYTTAGFQGINWPLRDPERRAQKKPHKFSVLVCVLSEAIKKLRAHAADAPDAQMPKSLFRGMSNRQIFDEFMLKGGTELAPMSSTADLKIALDYSHGPSGTISTLLWLRTESFMDRGVSLEWVSAFPFELEFLYPPLSYLKPIHKEPIILRIGSSIFQIVEVKINM
jgi:hypothetical protein